MSRLYSPPIQHSEPRNEKIARVLYLRKSIETWGRGLTRIANECARVGLPVPEVKEEYGCVTTVFRRPDWTGANTPDQRTGTSTARTGTGVARTGTGRGLSGTGWTIIGMASANNVGALLARLPKLRKDARANVETVLHELIADKSVTIPQICARTGMALRTINNALATLRNAKIVLPREVAEKQGEVTEKVTEKSGEVTEKVTEKLSETDERIIALIQSNPHITQKMLSEAIGLTRPYIGRKLLELQARKIIRRVGPDKGGYWEVSRMVNSILKNGEEA